VCASEPASLSKRQLLERCKHVRDDHLRYFQKWGLIRPVGRGDARFSLADVALVRQVDEALGGGADVRTVLRQLQASRDGQLALDFRIEAQPAKVLRIRQREVSPASALPQTEPREPEPTAHQYFVAASAIDDGSLENGARAAAGYRRALELDPYLVPALINLANIHYADDHIPEAQALYERAIAIDGEVFEAHFNLGNIFHDLARYREAQACYREALRLNPQYADAHFYLAVTLEKGGLSHDARAHWRAYQQLAPQGEWVDLAREFSD
jgi:tetratricopeptide (TPR) repeat protein